jgi:AraC family transcriptional regulator of adaptative response / DNA-3-methyladenine glycosylase II
VSAIDDRSPPDSCPWCAVHRSTLNPAGSAPEVVCRAVRWILAGALDDASEESLAATVGMSARHLRRLSLEYIGVTPSALASYARAQLARRLLHDTDMPASEVAYAVGFGSVRQFNRVFLETFRETPHALRARLQERESFVLEGGLALHLPMSGRVDISAFLGRCGATMAPGVESVDEMVYRRSVRVDGEVGAFEVSRSAAQDEVIVTVHLPRLDGIVHVIERIRTMLGVDAGSTGSSLRLPHGPDVRRLIRRKRHRSAVVGWTAFEAAVKAILGAPHDPASSRRLAAVVQQVGMPLRELGHLGLTHCFPSPQELSHLRGAATAHVDIGLARTLTALSTAVQQGKVSIEQEAEPIYLRVRSFISVEGVTPGMADRFAWMLGDRGSRRIFVNSTRTHQALHAGLTDGRPRPEGWR